MVETRGVQLEINPEQWSGLITWRRHLKKQTRIINHKNQQNMKQLKLIGFFLCLLIMGLVIGANAQKRTILETHFDEERNLISVVYKQGADTLAFDPMSKEEFNKEIQDKFTGEVFTDYKGNKLPILLSVNQKRFIVRKSRNGNWYRYYLKS